MIKKNIPLARAQEMMCLEPLHIPTLLLLWLGAKMGQGHGHCN